MIFQAGENSYDITLICMGVIGLMMVIGYGVFSYWVTHKGDFYHIRRWKASLWVSGISGVIASVPLASVPLIFLFAASVDSSVVDKKTSETIVAVIGLFLFYLTFIIPFLFVVTIGTHHQLTWWLNSDDYLDKIWKDPNRGHKSPIQEL